jgi:hypothetical protein
MGDKNTMDLIPFISSYPAWVRIFLLVWLAIGAGVLIFVPRTTDHPHPTSPLTSPILSPPQERLLGLIADYQRQFAANKLIIGRTDGRLYFDDSQTKGEGISLVHDLYGSEDATNRASFERLVESMPPEYLRLLPEMRFDSPFVASVTEAGLRYLRR